MRRDPMLCVFRYDIRSFRRSASISINQGVVCVRSWLKNAVQTKKWIFQEKLSYNLVSPFLSRTYG